MKANKCGLGASLLLAASLACAAPTPDLSIGAADVRIVANDAGGYDLFIRKKAGIASVLLTETTKDPAMKADNFAYRSASWNEVNGDEKRLLNGKFLISKNDLYSLISSTPKPDAQFGTAFHVLIPAVLVYGYKWSRSGTVAVGNGTFINIRAFQKPYADYSGSFADNPYKISISTRPRQVEAPPPPPPPIVTPPPEPAPAPPPPPEPAPLPPAPDGPPSSQIDGALRGLKGESLDLVLCIDTTSSMQPYMDDLKRNLIKLVKSRIAAFKEFRMGIVLFKDYFPEDYITRKIPFTTDLGKIDASIQSLLARGGGDIPEAVHEGLMEAATQFDWKADVRLAFLVTDAPPHPIPRGNIGWIDAARALDAQRIELVPIIVPTLGGDI